MHAGLRGLGLLLLALGIVATMATGALADIIGEAPTPDANAPVIVTDKADYAPGELVTLSGWSWQPGEAIHVYVEDDQGRTWSHDADTTAADDGTFAYSFNLPNWFVATYTATAAGDSGTATVSFTDGNVKASANLAAGDSWTFTYSIYEGTKGKSGNPDAPNHDCSAPAKSEGSASVPGSEEKTAGGAGTLDSAQLTASASSTLGRTFSHWTGPNSFSDNDLTICVIGAEGSTSYVAHYAAAVVDTTPPVITATVTGTLGSNGWYRSDVSVSWTVTDAQSPITSQTGCGDQSVSTDTSGATYTCTATSAGGSDSQSVTIKRDATAPIAAASATVPGDDGPVGYAAGTWTNKSVTVSFTGSDNMSGPAGCTAAETFSSDTSSGSKSGTCTDAAGNISSETSFGPVQIDKTAPGVTVSLSSADGTNGWHKTAPSYTVVGSDTGSGVASCDADGTYAGADGTDLSITKSCTDNAGNSNDGTSATFKLDSHAPAIDCDDAPTEWSATDHTIACTASDGTSGIADDDEAFALTTDVAAGTQTDNASTDSRTVTDAAGNSTTAGPITGLKVDKKAPAVTVTLATDSPTANAAGWFKAAPKFTFSGDDGDGSGEGTCDADETYQGADGTGLTVSGDCTDAVGNSDTGTSAIFKLDTLAPAIDCDDAPTEWSATDHTIACTASDGTSGIADDDEAFALTTDVAAGTQTDNASTDSRTVTDAAGNSTTAGPITGLKVDKKAPAVTVTLATDSPTANDAGWFKAAPKFTFSGDDGDGSGGGSCEPDKTYSGDDGTGLTVSGDCTDAVGNSDTGTSATFKLDRVDPSIEITSPADLSTTSGDIIDVAGNSSDDRSGIASVKVNTHAAGYDGTAQTFLLEDLALTCATNEIDAVATDRAGNTKADSISLTRYCYSVRFLKPIDQSSTGNYAINVGKNGRVIPVKVRITRNDGLEVTGANAPGIFSIGFGQTNCATGAVLDTVETYGELGVNSNTNEFRWNADPSAPPGFWMFNLDAKQRGLTVGSCYRIDVFLTASPRVKLTTDVWALMRSVR